MIQWVWSLKIDIKLAIKKLMNTECNCVNDGSKSPWVSGGWVRNIACTYASFMPNWWCDTNMGKESIEERNFRLVTGMGHVQACGGLF